MTSNIIVDGLEQEATWFSQFCDARLKVYFENNAENIEANFPPPDISQLLSPYAEIIRHYKMSFSERFVFLMAFMPHLRPQTLDIFRINNSLLNLPYTEFGGWRGINHVGFLPTCETAAFILAGDDLLKRFAIADLFKNDHFFIQHNLLKFEQIENGEPLYSSPLILSSDCLQRLTQGKINKPNFSEIFPATLLQTQLNWSDLVVNQDALEEINNVITWHKSQDSILKNCELDKLVKPGNCMLFYGPPGTGKTLTATLIGKEVNADVYRIDLSMAISHCIEKTIKNIANIFDQAQNKNWILYLDEADFIFGKNTKTKNEHKSLANQVVSYLAHSIESFPGVIILSANNKENIAPKLIEKCQSEVQFTMPDKYQRKILWERFFSKNDLLDTDVDFQYIADRYKLSGGALVNIGRYAVILATKHNRSKIIQRDLLEGIKRELMKTGKSL